MSPFWKHRYDHVTSAETTAVLVVGWTVLAVFFGAKIEPLPGWLDTALRAWLPGVPIHRVAHGLSIALGAVTFYVLIYLWLRGVRALVPFLREPVQ